MKGHGFLIRQCIKDYCQTTRRTYMSTFNGVWVSLIRRPWGACWMVAEGGEGENPLPFSLTSPKTGREGRGVGGVSRLRFPVPTSKAAVSADTHAFARLPPGGLRKIVMVGPWRAGPGLDPATLTGSLPASQVFNFLWVRVSKP